LLSYLPILLASADPITGIVLLAAVGVYSFVSWFAQNKKTNKLKESWRQLASANAWTFSEKRSSPLGEISAEFEQIKVVAYSHVAHLGKEPNAYTYIIAKLPAYSNFFIKLRPETTGTALQKILGQQEIIIGDNDFDDKYNIQSNSTTLCKLWLDAKVRTAILYAAPYKFYLANGEVSLVREGLEEDLELLKNTIKDVVALASQGNRLAEQWRSFASALRAESTAKDEIPEARISALCVEHHGLSFMIRLASTKEGPVVTQITTSHTHNAGNFLISESTSETTAHTIPRLPGYQLRASSPEKIQQVLTQELTDSLRRLPLVSLEANHEGLTLILEGFTPPIESVQLALDICAELSTHSQGPYR
jgi:hypothetical protein